MRFRLFNTFEPPGAPIFKDLLPFLAKKGHEINVVISDISYRPIKSDYFEKSNLEKIKYNYMRSISLTKNKYISKLSTMISYSFSAIINSLFSKRVHKNIFLTQPPLFFLWGFILFLLKRERYICVMMDIYPDIATKAGIISDRGLVAKATRFISNFALKQAESVIVIGRCMKEKLERLGISRRKIIIITNWVDEDSIKPIPHFRNSFKQIKDLNDKFIIMYSGNMGFGHYFDDILEVAKRIKELKDVIFLFVGGGVRLNEIKEYKNIHHLENIKLMPYQSYEIISQSLSSADIHFISLRDGFEGLMVPSKIYSILAVGRPILYQGPLNSEIAFMIKKYNIGFAIKRGEIKELELNLLSIKNNYRLKKSLEKRSRSVLERYFNRESRLKLYENILTR